mmetsp:Transcript_1768/g.5810  ORF Transcript_1768/g.5810 Transcript_1768/m.5810 type:complete len:216 (-) Transcript_1768:629-1276(-)
MRPAFGTDAIIGPTATVVEHSLHEESAARTWLGQKAPDCVVEAVLPAELQRTQEPLRLHIVAAPRVHDMERVHRGHRRHRAALGGVRRREDGHRACTEALPRVELHHAPEAVRERGAPEHEERGARAMEGSTNCTCSAVPREGSLLRWWSHTAGRRPWARSNSDAKQRGSGLWPLGCPWCMHDVSVEGTGGAGCLRLTLLSRQLRGNATDPRRRA